MDKRRNSAKESEELTQKEALCWLPNIIFSPVNDVEHRIRVKDMGGDDNKWFIAGRRRKAKRHHDANKNSRIALESERGWLPTVAATTRSSASAAEGMATSPTSAHPRTACYRVKGCQWWGATTAPRPTSSPRCQLVAGGTESRLSRASLWGWRRLGDAVSVTARPRPPPEGPPRGTRGRGIPRHRDCPPEQVGDWKHHVPGSPKMWRWRAASAHGAGQPGQYSAHQGWP